MTNQQGTLARSCGRHHLSMAGRAAALIALLAANVAWAVDRTWINTSGGTFNTPGNWQGGVTPSAADTAIFNLNSNGRTDSLAVPHAGKEVRRVMLDAHPPTASIALLTPP